MKLIVIKDIKKNQNKTNKNPTHNFLKVEASACRAHLGSNSNGMDSQLCASAQLCSCPTFAQQYHHPFLSILQFPVHDPLYLSFF